MSQEEKFHKILIDTNIFSSTPLCKLYIPHPNTYSIELEVDNVAQKGKVLFIFEGKNWKIKDAVNQLKIRYKSFQYNKSYLIKRKNLADYTAIHLFVYSLKRKYLTEYDERGNQIKQHVFDDVNELKEILRKL